MQSMQSKERELKNARLSPQSTPAKGILMGGGQSWELGTSRGF